MDTKHYLNTSDVQRRFDRAARGFDTADFAHGVTRDGLLSRIAATVVDAHVVVDLGAGTGAAMQPLRQRFRGADIIALDISRKMLDRCRTRGSWFSKPKLIQADATSLPFANQSVDVIFSNMLLPWVNDSAKFAREISRVLRQDGLFAFTTLGPDSLFTLRQAWAEVDDYDHVNRFQDMHDLGDAMVGAGLRDPVLDVDRLLVTYASADKLFRDLTATGARNSLSNRRRSLSGRSGIDAVRSRLDAGRVRGKLQLPLELIYGHCWGAGQQRSGTDVHIEPGAIPIRSR